MRPPTNNWRYRQTEHCDYAEIVIGFAGYNIYYTLDYFDTSRI